MGCAEGRAVALGLCSHCLAGEPVEAMVGQIARLARELEESRRERSAARAEALTAQASLRRVERELEEARERERGYREALCRALDRGFPGDTHEGDCAVTRGMQCDCWIGQARTLVATPDTEGET